MRGNGSGEAVETLLLLWPRGAKNEEARHKGGARYTQRARQHAVGAPRPNQSSASAVRVSFLEARMAGPWITHPLPRSASRGRGSPRDRSARFQLTWQPKCVQSRRQRMKVPGLVTVRAVFRPPTSEPALTGGKLIEDRSPPAVQVIAEEVLGDHRVSLMNIGADAERLQALCSEQSAYGFARPRIVSLRIIAAAVPLVMPHFLKPVAT